MFFPINPGRAAEVVRPYGVLRKIFVGDGALDVPFGSPPFKGDNQQACLRVQSYLSKLLVILTKSFLYAVCGAD